MCQLLVLLHLKKAGTLVLDHASFYFVEPSGQLETFGNRWNFKSFYSRIRSFKIHPLKTLDFS